MFTFAVPVLSAIFGNQWTRLAAVAAICFATGWVKGWWAYPRPDIPAIQRAAADARDLTWQKKLDEQEKAAQQAIDAAIAAGKSEPPVPTDKSERMRECGKSPTCRDRRK